MRRIGLLAAIGFVGVVMATVCQASMAAAATADASPIGRKIEAFSLPDHHGRDISLSELKGQNATVVVFLGAECPLAKIYAPRLAELAKEFASKGVAFVGVDANLQDSLSDIAAFAKSHELGFPVLKDLGNKLADAMGAQRTPEVFLLDGDQTIRYCGRIDDQYGFKTGAGYVKPKLNERFLASAIDEVLAGKPVAKPMTKADGCLIGRVKHEPHGDVTYANQIARIFNDRCVNCHRPGEIAPFAMTSYDEVQGWAEMIGEVVAGGQMPPWFADPGHGHFSNDARLTEDEKKLITTWIANGCPEGDTNKLPAPRQFVDGWQIGTPDQICYMSDEAYKVPAEGTVEYQFFTVDPGWKEDKWVQASECRPSNRSVVHHIIVFIKVEGQDEFEGGRGGLAGYAPGTPPHTNPAGTATFVPAGAKLVFQLHYTPNGTAQDDRSAVGFKFADPKTVKKTLRDGMIGDVAFKIPPGDGNFEIKGKHRFLKDTLLLSLMPHMHLRGKSFKFEAQYPDGTKEVLLDVPQYDFNWQLRYYLAEPKLMPKGTRLECTAHFDNSADNLANPDPTATVKFGEQTWEEMMFGFYTSIDPKEDRTAEKVAGAKSSGGDKGGDSSSAAPE
ncbi:MAG TPA: redoxin domain-containing protein [Pirellulales bacterium]|jgi:peroxiredoxin